MKKRNIDKKKTARSRLRKNSLPIRIALLTSAVYVALYQPLVSYADGIVTDPAAAAANQASVDSAANGVEVLNIANPNDRGLSHNKFQEFNVQQTGLIINNSSQDTIESSLAGHILGNPNLQSSGQEARLILNEVTSGNRSALNGFQELVGSQAEYILANPNGITCNGCGFINFPRASLTTGAPAIDSLGNLTGFDINRGDILVGPEGLNAGELDHFDIISRSLVLNGAIHARDLHVVTGRNEYDYITEAVTKKADNGSASPAFAIDSSLLGGMYAYRIRLIGTEAGVGVRMLGDVAASVDDITLTTAGSIYFSGNTVSAERNINISSSLAANTAGNKIEFDTVDIYATNDLTLAGGDTVLTGGKTEAGNDLMLNANSLTDTNGRRLAGNNASITVAASATINGSTLQADKILALSANRLELDNGKLIGAGAAWRAGAAGTGDLDLQITGDMNLNNALVASGNTLTINANNLVVDANSSLSNGKGILTLGETTITAGTAVDNAGDIRSEANLTISAAQTINRINADINSNAQLSINTDSLENRGTLYGATSTSITTGMLDNYGSILSAGQMNLLDGGRNASTFNNFAGAEILANILGLEFTTLTNSGSIAAVSSANITAVNVTNAGLIGADGALTLASGSVGTGTLTNQVGAEIKAGTLNIIDLAQVTNRGTLNGVNNATITAQTVNNESTGVIAAGNNLVLGDGASTSGTFVNKGEVKAVSDLTIESRDIYNEGLLQSGNDASFDAYLFQNARTIESGHNMQVSADQFLNFSIGSMIANGSLSIINNYVTYNSDNARIIAQGDLRIESLLDSADPIELILAAQLNPVGQQVKNRGLIFSGNNMDILVARSLENISGGTLFTRDGTMTLGAADVASIGDVTVINDTSNIENMNGSIFINARVFENTGGDEPATTTTEDVRTSGTFYDGGSTRSVYSECATLGDSFGVDQVGFKCAKSVTTITEHLGDGANTAPRAKLIAGQDINIHVTEQATNYLSLISAGRDINISGPAGSIFTNQAFQLTTTETPQIYIYERGGYCPFGSEHTNLCFFDGYQEATIIGIPIPKYTEKSFINIFYDILTYSAGIDSTIEAGGALNITGGLIVNNISGTQEQNSLSITTPSPRNPDNPGAIIPVTTSVLPTVGNNANPQLTNSVTALNGSPFFVQNQDPNANVLFETDPAFGLSALYGSDAFLAMLGYDPNRLRLGDAYYEQQLVRQQVLAEAGQRFIVAGLSNENEQFKYLMDNAVAVSDDLQLTIGVALTSDQINNLNKDIIWMVEVEVEGQTVLAPQLYLSHTTRAEIAQGAKFVASNINITTEGDVNNAGGTFVAYNDMNIDTGGAFTNRLGSLVASNELNIIAENDIINQSGKIKGGDVTLESKEGNVRNETLVAIHMIEGLPPTAAGGERTTDYATKMGTQASIESTGNLTIKAKQDIVSKGANISAEGDGVLDAGRDITLTTITEKTVKDSVTVETTKGGSTKVTKQISKETKHVGSGLEIGGNLTTKSGRDTNIIGSDVTVAKGADITAQGDVNVVAVKDTYTAKIDTKETSSFGTSGATGDPEADGISGVSAEGELEIFSTTRTKTQTNEETVKGSGLNIGGALTVTAKKDIKVAGSAVDGGDIKLDAGNDVKILAVEAESNVTTNATTASISLGGDASLDGAGGGITFENENADGKIEQTQNTTSSIKSRGNLTITAGNDVTEQGTDVEVADNTTIVAGRDFNSEAVVDTYYEEGDTKGVSIGVRGDINLGLGTIAQGFAEGDAATIAGVDMGAGISGAGSGTVSLSVTTSETHTDSTTKTSKTSSFSSGGNLTISAGRDANLEGTQSDADGDISLSAGNNVNITAAQDSVEYNEQTTDVSVTVTAEYGGGGVSGEGSHSETHEKSTTAKTASLGAGGNLTIKAGNNVGMEGTDLAAGGEASIEATAGSVEFKEARDTYEYTHDSTSASAGISASKTGGGLSGSGATVDEGENNSTAKTGSINAGSLNIKSGKDTHLVGTKMDITNDATIDVGGKFTMESAVNTASSSADNTSVSVSVAADFKDKGGSGSLGVHDLDEGFESTTHDNAQLNVGNKLTLKTGGDAELKGATINAKQMDDSQIGGNLVIESRKDTETSHSNSVDFDIALSIPGKEARDKVKKGFNKVKNKVTGKGGKKPSSTPPARPSKPAPNSKPSSSGGSTTGKSAGTKPTSSKPTQTTDSTPSSKPTSGSKPTGNKPSSTSGGKQGTQTVDSSPMPKVPADGMPPLPAKPRSGGSTTGKPAGAKPTSSKPTQTAANTPSSKPTSGNTPPARPSTPGGKQTAGNTPPARPSTPAPGKKPKPATTWENLGQIKAIDNIKDPFETGRGIAFTAASGVGFNTENSNTNTTSVNEVSGINTETGANITVAGKTTLTGGVINDESGNLNLITGALETSDLNDMTSTENVHNADVNLALASIGSRAENTDTTTTQSVHSTIGEGNITVGGVENPDLDVNRDATNVVEESSTTVEGATFDALAKGGKEDYTDKIDELRTGASSPSENVMLAKLTVDSYNLAVDAIANQTGVSKLKVQSVLQHSEPIQQALAVTKMLAKFKQESADNTVSDDQRHAILKAAGVKVDQSLNTLQLNNVFADLLKNGADTLKNDAQSSLGMTAEQSQRLVEDLGL